MSTSPELMAKVRRVWDKSAPSYDKQIAFFEKIWFGGGREWLGTRARGWILEVAIGTGLNLQHYRADATVMGIELSPAMLAIAQQRVADLGRDVALHLGDTAIGEMKRVLVPPIHAAQWLLERLTIRTAGERFTRRQVPLVRAAGLDRVEVERLKAGTIERVAARKILTAWRTCRYSRRRNDRTQDWRGSRGRGVRLGR